MGCEAGPGEGVKYRLFVDADVIEQLDALPATLHHRLRRRFRQIQESPHRFSDFTEPDESGRLHDVHLFAGFAIYYWDDFADRHIKITGLERAGS